VFWFRNALNYVQDKCVRMRRGKFGGQALDAFFVSAPAGLVILDSNLRVLRANETVAEMIGVSPRAIIGQSPRMLVPQMASTVEPLLRNVLSSRTPNLNLPIRGETPKQPGVERHWIVSIFPIQEIKGRGQCVGAIVVEVTDSVQFEHVKRSEALLAEAERLADLGSWEVDLLTAEETWSVNLCRMLGFDGGPPRFPENRFWELVHPEDRESVRTIIERAMKDRQPYEYQARFVLPNAGERVLLTRGRPVVDAKTRVLKRVGVTRDITDRIKAELALQESESRYRDLLENSRDLICLHDLEGCLLWMNEPPARILGYSRDQLIGRRIPDMLEPGIRHEFDNYIERIRRDGYAGGLMQVLTRAGERRVWEYQNTLRRDAPGGPIVRGMAHDVTELKAAEKSQRMFRTLIDQSDDGFEVVDCETFRILDVNQKECSDLGYTRDELLELTIFDTTLDRSDFRLTSQQLRKSGSLRLESVHRKKDGTTFPVEVNIRFAPVGRGYFVVAVRDITERKQIEQALRDREATVRSLFQIAQILSQTFDLQNIFDALTLQSMILIGAGGGCSGLRTEKGFSCDSLYNGSAPKRTGRSWPSGAGIPGWVIENRRTYVANDAEQDRLVRPEIREVVGLQNVLCVPIFNVPQNEVIAFLSLHNKTAGFSETDVATAEGIAKVASIAIQNALSYQRVCRAEALLQRLSSELMVSRDQERRCIAGVLHEEVAQDLSGVKLHLGWLSRQRGSRVDSSVVEVVAESKELIERCLAKIRNLSYELHPPLLELGGLWIAILSYAHSFSRSSGISVSVEIAESLARLPQADEIAVFRILQESLNNVHRHSGSEKATIRASRRENGAFVLEVCDFGKGLQPGTLAGLGIWSMRERARELGGDLEIESAAGGTTVRLLVAAVGKGPDRLAAAAKLT